MLMKSKSWLSCLFVLLTGCGHKPNAPDAKAKPSSLTDARRGFVTKLLVREKIGESVPVPPSAIFDLVKYSSSAGELSAYVSHPPSDGKKHPAILWLVGGFSNSISEIAWTPGPADNDQSASVFREAGVLMMYPSLRGGNDNPGYIENFYGEVDDVLAARDWLAKQPSVDPARIYLGGHSTGGTLALLCAESSGGFRDVFAFGPVTDPRVYGTKNLYYEVGNARESELRSPVKWLAAITSPTFVFEGINPRSNIASLQVLERANHNPAVRFYPVPNATHFSDLRPLSRLIAQKILHDEGTTPSITFTPQEVASAINQPGTQ